MATQSVMTALARSTVFRGVDAARLESIGNRGRMRSVAPKEIGRAHV